MVKPIESIRRLPAVGVLAERQYGGFLALSALVGVAVGLGAAALVWALEGMHTLLQPLGIEEGRSLWIFLTVPAGLFLAWWVARRFAPEVAGDGVPEAAAALAVHGGRMRGRVAPLKLLATTLTLGTGGSAGREGPIVQIGAAIGSWLSARFKLGEDQVRSLVAAGAGAAIGASFHAPIAGMLFALEVILASFALRHMSAIVIASVTAAVTTQLLVGPEQVLIAAPHRLQAPSELILYAAMALVIVGLGYLFLRLVDRLAGMAARHHGPFAWLRPISAGLLVAGLVFVEPQLFGTGQEVTSSLLRTGSPDVVWWALGLLALGKAVATSLTITSGASGGAFMPSLFMGAAAGAGFAHLVQPFWGGNQEIVPGAFAVVGMAAMFAVVARAPLTSILIVFEVTGAREYELILPLMLAATLGTFLAERFLGESVYTMALRRKGIKIRQAGEVDLLDTVRVSSVMIQPPFVAHPGMTLDQVETRLLQHRSHGAPVVDDSALVGIITMSDITRASGPPESTLVSYVMTPRPVTVTPSTPVSRALERMAALGIGRLPVVDEEDPGRLVGLFRREEAVRAYHEGLTSETDAEMNRLRLAQRTDPGAGYYDFRIPPGSMADGRQVKQVAWPEGSTLVAIRRHREVLVPTGDTELVAGDVVTAFGTEGSKQRMISRLNAGAEEPTAEIPALAEGEGQDHEEQGDE